MGQRYLTVAPGLGSRSGQHGQPHRTATSCTKRPAGVIHPSVLRARDLLGDEHPATLSARANLAASYRQAGRTHHAIDLLERVLADRERLLGDEHPTR